MEKRTERNINKTTVHKTLHLLVTHEIIEIIPITRLTLRIKNKR